MSIEVNARAFGFEEFDQLLDSLGWALRKETLERALIRGAEPFLERGRQMSPPLSSKQKHPKAHIKNSWAAVRFRARNRADRQRLFGEAVVRAGPLAPHAHLVEDGHAIVVGARPTTRAARQRLGPGQRKIGHVPARPFIRPAWDVSKAAVEERFLEVIYEEVGKTIDGVTKRAASGKLRAKDVDSLLEGD